MADRRRLVTINPSSWAVTTVKDLEDSTSYMAVRGSFQPVPPARRPVLAQRQRRYGGARTVHETHDNGAITWRALVAGATLDAAILNAEQMLIELERARTDLFFEWRPDGATSSVYYEIRGPAEWKPTYEWAQFTGAKSWYFDVSIPVAPLAWGDQVTVHSASSVTLPALLQLGTAIPGDAPALADVSIRHNGGSAAPIFAMLAWVPRPGSPLSGSVAPFGIIEAENANTLTTWASFGSDSSFRGSSGIRTTTSGAGSASAVFAIDPSVLPVDDFAIGEVTVELWARVELNAGVVAPTLFTTLEPNAGANFGQVRYAGMWGALGKPLVRPSSGTVKRFVRLGTITMPVDAIQPLKYNLKVAATWAAGSSGVFGLDYVTPVLAHARALSPTGKPNDSAYPDFIMGTGDTTKTIRSDLSGLVASATGNAGRDSGLGGSMIELPPGNVDMLIKLSSLVPDDPTSDTTSEQLSHAATTVTVKAIPRYFVAKGA